MLVFNEISQLGEETAVALGFFDGLHIAHREVIGAAVMAASLSEKKLTAVVLTFRMGKSAPKKKLTVKMILPDEQKLKELEKLNVQMVIAPSFDDIDSIEAADFFKEILIKKLNVKFISCGYDYRFGNGAQGDITLLKSLCDEFGVALNVTEKLVQNGQTVSSTLLREAICKGDIKTVNSLLGYNYYIEKKIEKGKKIGSTIGFPTINQQLNENCIILKHGVYKTKTLIGEKIYDSITNIGVKPTIEGERTPLAETFIINFSGDIYNETIKVIFQNFIREEKKFNSIKDLKTQIEKDIKSLTQP